MAEWRNAPDGATSKLPFEMGVSDFDELLQLKNIIKGELIIVGVGLILS